MLDSQHALIVISVYDVNRIGQSPEISSINQIKAKNYKLKNSVRSIDDCQEFMDISKSYQDVYLQGGHQDWCPRSVRIAILIHLQAMTSPPAYQASSAVNPVHLDCALG